MSFVKTLGKNDTHGRMFTKLEAHMLKSMPRILGQRTMAMPKSMLRSLGQKTAAMLKSMLRILGQKTAAMPKLTLRLMQKYSTHTLSTQTVAFAKTIQTLPCVKDARSVSGTANCLVSAAKHDTREDLEY